MSRIDYNLQLIKGIAFDVDGVLSTATVTLGPDGNPLRSGNLRDGFAMQYATKIGFPLAIITGGRADSILGRYKALGLKDIYMEAAHKLPVLMSWMEKEGLKPEEVAYVGDDLPDFEVMSYVGLSVAPADAAHEIRTIARYVSPVAGGYGVGRDVIEQVLRAKGLWPTTADAYGW